MHPCFHAGVNVSHGDQAQACVVDMLQGGILGGRIVLNVPTPAMTNARVR